MADDRSGDRAAEQHDGETRRDDLPGLPFLRLSGLLRFLLPPLRLRGRRRGRRVRVRERLGAQQRRGIELVVEIVFAGVGVFHQREDVAELQLHAGRELRLLQKDADRLFLFRERVVQLLAAVVRGEVRRRDERQHEVRAVQVRRDALRPLAAGVDALVVPDAVAAVVHIADDLQHRVRVGMGVADENIRLAAFIGFEQAGQRTTISFCHTGLNVYFRVNL